MLQDVLESQMGMQLAEMKQYSELDPVERTHTVLPGAHPPVRGFYLIKPSPIASLGKSARSASLMTRLRLPRCPSSTHSLVPSSSVSDVSVEALDSSMHGPTVPDTVQEDISDVVVDIDDTQLQH